MSRIRYKGPFDVSCAHFSCAIEVDSGVTCWGLNARGQLGDGTTQSRHKLVVVDGTIGATLLSAGGEHVCAVLADETLRCWGDNRYGQLGDGGSGDLAAEPVDPIHFGSEKGGKP